MRALKWSARIAVGLVLVLWFVWTVGTVYYSNLSSERLRAALAAGYVLLAVLLFARVRPLRRGFALAFGVSLVIALVYWLVPASNARTWLPDVAVAPTIGIDGGHVTVHGVRNFRYRSESDFDAHWEDRSYDLAQLRGVDLVMSYWGPTDYCHTFVSFGFANGDQLAVSVETRKEVGEEYSMFGGLFKRYELVYVFGDERDLIGVRARLRGEHVYLYHVRAGPQRLRELFLSYAEFANGLAREPQFYGVLRNSCGINILNRVAETGEMALVGRDALLNGTWDRYLYEHGAIDTSLPFEVLREKSLIDARAQEAGDAPDFSRRIRAGLPGPPR